MTVIPAQQQFDVGQAFKTGMQGVQASDYMQDRETLQTRQAEQKQQKAQAQMKQIFSTIDPESPEFYDHMRMAAGWYGKENPDYSSRAVEIAKMPEPELREWAKSNRKLLGLETPAQTQPKTEQLTIYGPGGDTKRIAAEKGVDYTPPEGWSLSKPKAAGMKVYDSQGNLIVDTGGGGMAKSTQGKLETETIADYETLHQLEEVKNVYQDEFLTYQGKAKGLWNKLKDKANIDLTTEEKQYVGSKKKFDQRVNQFFNAYRKMITGAAASEKELESLKKAVINTDLSPTEFKAAYDDMVQGYQRSIRINNRLLREGVRRGTSKWGKRFDDLYMSDSDDVIDERAADLQKKNPGATDDEIAEMLMGEGYL
jgi:hypothetical protein